MGNLTYEEDQGKFKRRDGFIRKSYPPASDTLNEYFRAQDGSRVVVLTGHFADAVANRKSRDSFYARKHPTIVVTQRSGDLNKGSVSDQVVSGYSSPYTAAMLPGRREDYEAVLPSYSTKDGVQSFVTLGRKEQRSLGNQDTIYGSVVVLRHKETGDTTTLRGVDTVIFDHDNIAYLGIEGNDSDYEHVEDIEEHLESGIMEAVPMEQLVLEAESVATPQEILKAKIFSTPEALEYIDKNIKEWQDDIKNGTTVLEDTVMGLGIDVEGRKFNPPTKPEQEQAIEQKLGISYAKPAGP